MKNRLQAQATCNVLRYNRDFFVEPTAAMLGRWAGALRGFYPDDAPETCNVLRYKPVCVERGGVLSEVAGRRECGQGGVPPRDAA